MKMSLEFITLVYPLNTEIEMRVATYLFCLKDVPKVFKTQAF